MSKPNSASQQVRSTFLQYFKRNGHEVVSSSGVVPRGDATLLFTNAGMVQFKDVFLGKDKRPYVRATTAQKCVRMSGKHNDLENVGRTARHHTFFEMLGNFSFGDYFKAEAIRYAWELLAGEYGLPRERLAITVFGGEDGVAADDEARGLWRKVTGFGDDRIIGLGKKDNFWSMGDTGPCGPCTEIHYFMGEGAPDLARFGEEPRADGSGWVEIWNLVFMQFNRDAGGALTPLPAQSVDTGMWLERLTAVMQGVRSNYETDLFRPLLELAAEIAGKRYSSSDSEDDVSLRVIADHARLAAVCLSEGVEPGPKEQGSALRQVMRRAVRHGVKLGIREPFLHRVTLKAVDLLGVQYPEMVERAEFIANQTRLEEETFRETVDDGLKLIAGFTDFRDCGGEKVMPGDVAFRLYETYGFPLDLTRVIGEERGFVVDDEGYRAAEELHRKRSRAKATVGEGIAEQYKLARQALTAPVQFTGYNTERDEGVIVSILKNGVSVREVSAGEEAEVITDKTPFYGESGGQVGDRGVLRVSGATFRVTDAQKPLDGLTVHVGRLEQGTIRVGDRVDLEVDHAARGATRRNHSATHLLHWALRKVLGTHVQQKGSKVGPDVLRFDYATTRPMTDEEVRRVEDLVNEEVLVNVPVRTEVTTQDEARKGGAMMIFEENYGDVVRMLRIGRESVELCGGTHVAATGDIGLFKIVSDEAVGKGTRRIVAVTGLNALAYLRDLEDRVRRAAEVFRASPADLVARAGKVAEEVRDLQKQVGDLRRKLADGGASGGADLTAQARTVGEARVLALRAPIAEASAMREYAEKLRDRLGNAVVLLGAVTDDQRVAFVCTVSKDLVGKYHAGKLVKEVASVAGGSGGGRPDMAQAGGTDPSKLDEALARFYALLA